MEALVRALSFFEAVRVAPATYAFPLEIGKPPYRICGAETLVRLMDAYLHFDREHAQRIFETQTVPMPKWWMPERREVYRHKVEGWTVPFIIKDGYREAELPGRRFGGFNADEFERITAALDTGQEIVLQSLGIPRINEE